MIVTRNTRARNRALRRAGFTLMEVMVVAAILVILAGVGSFAIFGYLESAKEKAAFTTIKKIEEAVTAYKLNHGEYPPNLGVLIQPDGNKPALLEQSDLVDPWDKEFVYEPQNLSPTGKPRIACSEHPIANF